jgi:SAM-dependent methyltransferase
MAAVDLETAPRAIRQGDLASFLSTLHCPYCGSALEILSDTSPDEALNYGILRCACAEYPVVDGIPILQQADGLNRAVAFIRRQEPHRALLQALSVFRVRWAHRSLWHRARYELACRRVVAGGAGATFEDAAQLLRRPKVFADYLVHRYANPSFLAAIGPMMLLKESNGRVLDLACGAGHASFLMGALWPDLSIVSADQDFVSLYLAKRFLAPNTTHVCWDVETPSPFPDRSFDTIFCLDAFHYFRAKRGIANELKRIGTAECLWLFPHLHNRLQPNLVAGIPLTPDGYLECFGLPDARLFDEAGILRRLSKDRILDLGEKHEASELNGCRTLTMVRGGAPLWRRHPGFPAALHRDRSRLALNPIYRVRAHGDDVELAVAWPNDVFREECGSVTAVLPSEIRLRAGELASLVGSEPAADEERLSDLTAQFVVVPLPPRYRAAAGAVP